MANNNKQQKALKQLLQGAGLGGGYGDLIRQAVLNDWSQGEFITALVHNDNFRQQFPGLMQGGNLAPFLTGQENASLSASNLAAAVKNYKTLWNGYRQAAQPYQGIAGHVGKDKLAALIKSQTSPDEYRAKLQAVATVKSNPEAMRIWEQQAKAAGLHDFNPFKAVLGAADQKFYDIYEATRLQQLGGDFGFTAKQANQIARSAPNTNAKGQPTGVNDIGSLVASLRQQVGDIGPELQNQGISNTMLASFIANPAQDPYGIAAKLAQIQATRRGTGSFVAGTQARRGAAGGPALYGDQPPAAY